jgi:hypothetical protein
VVDFEEHCVGNLWVMWLHGPWQKNMWGITKICYDSQFYFMAPEQISNMSLNELKRRFATRNKNITQPKMDELLIALDLGNLVLFRGTAQLSFCFP